MPTGYTAAVQDGSITELEPFALMLARGMGALIMMRDDPSDAPIPERFEPSASYNTTALAEARAERNRLYALTDADAQAAANAEFAEYEAAKDRAEQEHRDQRARYEAMITKVEAWQGAPEGIKEFALEQLRRGMDFDCREPFRYWSEPPLRNGAEWKAGKLKKASRDIAHHTKAIAEEEARTEGRNAWLAQLRKSLAGPAQGIEAGTATTGTDVVHESPVAEGDAP